MMKNKSLTLETRVDTARRGPQNAEKISLNHRLGGDRTDRTPTHTRAAFPELTVTL